MLKTYKKKPVEIEAIQYTGDNKEEIKEFINVPKLVCTVLDELCITTLEGVLKASVGDYIIKGIAGEFYPCKPDIFNKTYIEIDDDMLLPEGTDIRLINPVEGDIILVEVDTDEFSKDNIEYLFNKIKDNFPNNNVICVPKNYINLKIDETMQN